MPIKPLMANDKLAWQSLWHDYLAFYQTELPQVITDNTWQKIIDDNSPIFGFGAWQGEENNKKLVGFVHVVLHPNTWNKSDCCYLEDLFVDKKLRGQGVGRALIEHIYAFAESKNCNRIYWVTDAQNIAAQKLYDSMATKTDFVQYRKNF